MAHGAMVMVHSKELGLRVHTVVQEWMVHKMGLLDQSTENEVSEQRMEHKMQHGMALE